MADIERSTKLHLPPVPPAAGRQQPDPPTCRLPDWCDRRLLADASRTSILLILVITFIVINQPVLAAERDASLSAIRRSSLTWTGITIAVSSMSRLGSTARRCAERVFGTLVGGLIGIAVAAAEQPPATAAGCVVSAFVSEAFARGYGMEYAAKLTLVTTIIASFPALLDNPPQSTRDTRRDAAKYAWARMLSILIGVAVVAIANVVWFPRAASDDALDAAVNAGRELRGLATETVAPLLVEKDGDDNDDDADALDARRAVVNAAVRRVRAYRDAVTKALDHAKYETAVGHLPTCVTCRQRRPPKDVEASTPPTTADLCTHFAVYIPVSASLVGRPRAGLPVAAVAAVERAAGRVAIALRALSSAVRTGFDASLVATVASRYGGRDPDKSANLFEALARGVTAAVEEATAGLATVRTAWHAGRRRRQLPPAPTYPALAGLATEVEWVENERARLEVGHRHTWFAAVQGARRPAHAEPSFGLHRLPATQNSANEHARWIAFLFELDETIAALREMDAAVAALGVAVGAWMQSEQAAPASLPPLPSLAANNRGDTADGA